MFKQGRVFLGGIAALLLCVSTSYAQLSDAWMVPAAANTGGVGGTYWRTDISIHNPQDVTLPVVVQFLETGFDNTVVPTLDLDIFPWETVNLWDVLGPDLFAIQGTGAFLVYVPLEVVCPENSCDFLVTSRTYTIDPWGGVGEFGQAIPGAALLEGTDWYTFGYATGILNDGAGFRCNIGVASWTGDWTMVQVDVQDEFGNILDSEIFDLPPFGHLQKRLRQTVTGGTLVFYVIDGPADAFVYPYASIVDQDTGDPSYFFAKYSGVGASAKSGQRLSADFPGRGRMVTPPKLSSRK
ncbi:MAG: hypothetical protein K8R59_11755 [Thermoanaerobaculales bacterium]|nr:hypothetical protein [Thermoanaerobaculales bacterium]